MKEAIRMGIHYDPEFPDIALPLGRGCHSVLRRIKEEWGTSLVFGINRKSFFHTSTDIDSSQSLKKRSTIQVLLLHSKSLFRRTTRRRPPGSGGPEKAFRFPPSSALAPLTNPRASFAPPSIEAAGLTPKAEFYGRERYDLLLGIVGAVASHRNTKTYQPLPTIRPEPLGRLCRINNNVRYLGTVIREVPPRTTPIQFLRELEKRLRLTKGMSGTGSLLDAVQLAETLGTAGLRSEQGAIGRSTGSLTIGHSCPEVVIVYSAGRKAAGEGGGHWARSISSEFPIQMEAPIKKILRRLRDRGLISRRRPWPIHVACLTNVSDGDIVNWSAGIAISPLSYYRCRDNLYQVRTIVDHQIRWSAIYHPGPQAQILGAEYNPKSTPKTQIESIKKAVRPLQNSQQHRAWEARIRSRSEQQGALNY
ncbi:UNVERIFIED_CONTAM: hypothetical protein Scaly_2902200 [Sesamum calycinum]|uniref:Domain X domain-containing protein n=1 Tax=Sesamum calycinum TaxID=2727403 RepID=A0AAW2L3C4_9LAMI